MRGEKKRAHITGAEGLFKEAEAPKAVASYLNRALTHPRGIPDKITLTVETLKAKPKRIKLLPVRTLRSGSHINSTKAVRSILLELGVSDKAIDAALYALQKGPVMRGASLMEALSARRIEPDKSRGVRAGRMGILKSALASLSRKLGQAGLDNDTVKEALLLASKVASCKGIIAELCASDDPDYTTGYIASKELGYIRIPHIKKKGSRKGGRVFFVKDGADAKRITAYLEMTPALVRGIEGFSII